MRSLPALLSRYAPSIRRAHRQYATGQSTRAVMESLRVSPAPFAPPRATPWRRWAAHVRASASLSAATGGWPVYVVSPRRRPVPGAVVFFHGGAYFREIRRPHWRFAGWLSRTTGSVCVVPVYPLAPGSTAREVVPAAVSLVRSVLDRGGPVVLSGDSAGAGLALVVAQALLGAGDLAPAGLLLLSPWVDVTCSDPGVAARAARDPWLTVAGLREAGDAYRGSSAGDDPWVSPIHGSLAGLPRMLVVSGTDDILNADAHRLVDAVRSIGGTVDLVEATGMIHDYALHATPEGRAARRLIARWIGQVRPTIEDRGGSPTSGRG